MKRTIAVLTLGLAALSAPQAHAQLINGTASPAPDYAKRGATEVGNVGPLAPSMQGKPAVVRIHADWCPACKATHATLDAVKQDYGRRINFIEFDVTNAQTAKASQAKAVQLGLAKFFDAAKSATSTVAVINPKTGVVYDTLYNDGNIDDYKAAINQALISSKS